MFYLSNTRASKLFFNDVDELQDFEFFEIYPIHLGAQPDGHAEPADYWSVVGIYKPAKVTSLPSFVVAELPTKRYAELFAQMCNQIVHYSPAQLVQSY